MKITAHLKVLNDGFAYYASPFPEVIESSCEEGNRVAFGPDYLNYDKRFAAVTVEFEVPDNFFKRLTLPVVQGKIT